MISTFCDGLDRFRTRIPGTQAPTLFYFGGRLGAWTGIGHSLYRHDKLFRTSFETTDQLIRELGMPSILPNFRGEAPAGFLDFNSRYYLTLVALQMAFTDRWVAEGVRPAATLGVSMGEDVALYAAGGISQKDTLRLAGARIRMMDLFRKDHVFFDLELRIDDFHQIESPRPLFPISETWEDRTIVICRASDVPIITPHLDRLGICRGNMDLNRLHWPVHSPRFQTQLPFFRSLIGDIQTQPLACDFYSCTLGRKVAKHETVPADLFEKLMVSPVFLHRTIRQAIHDGYHTIINMSAYSSGTLERLTGPDAADHRPAPTVYDSYKKGQPEWPHFRNVVRQWKRRHYLQPVKNWMAANFSAGERLYALVGRAGRKRS